MTYAELVRASAYGSAFGAALIRGCHGHTRTTETKLGEGIEYVRDTIDARAEAKRVATEAAVLAVESLEEA